MQLTAMRLLRLIVAVKATQLIVASACVLQRAARPPRLTASLTLSAARQLSRVLPVISASQVRLFSRPRPPLHAVKETALQETLLAAFWLRTSATA